MTTPHPESSWPRKVRKLRKNVQPLLGDNETLIGAVVLHKGAKTLTLALLSVFLSPILGLIGFLFFRTSAILVRTDKQTRLYGVSGLWSLRPTRFLSSVGLDVGPGLRSGALRHGGEEWRVAEGWEKATDQFSAAWEKPEDVSAPASHDATLASNRQKSWGLTALVMILTVAVIGGAISLATRPNSFSVSLQASERYCGDSNYSEYLAVETEAGTVLVAGFLPRDAERLDMVHARRADQFSELVRGWRDIKNDVDVVCASRSASGDASRSCSGSSEQFIYQASRWDAATNTELSATSLDTSLVPCDSAGYTYPSEQAFDMLLCALDACRRN